MSGIAKFYWSIREQRLPPHNINVIFDFWKFCIEKLSSQKGATRELLSDLSRLAIYVVQIGEAERKLLIAVAPHISVGYNAPQFIEKIDELTQSNPGAVAEIMSAMLSEYVPQQDHNGHLLSIVAELGRNPATRLDAIRFADQLRHIRGGLELFEQLKREAPLQ